MGDLVDFREQVRAVIGDLKWAEDMCFYGDGPAPDELQEMGEIAARAYVVIRLLIRVGLDPNGLWGPEADDLWIKPATEWPKP